MIKYANIECATCGKVFGPKALNAKYCSEFCRGHVSNKEALRQYRQYLFKLDGEILSPFMIELKDIIKKEVAIEVSAEQCKQEEIRIRDAKIVELIEENKKLKRYVKKLKNNSKKQTYDCKYKDYGANYYVYFWFKNDEIFPFYVGRGVGNRYLAVHYAAENRIAYCERVRVSSPKFEAVKIATNLTEKEAVLMEAIFISYFRSLKVPLTNQK